VRLARPRIAVVLAVALGLPLSGPIAAQAAPVSSPAHAIGAHVFAPYFETYAGSNLAALSSASGARELTLAFLEAPTRGSCDVVWDGDATMPVAWSTFGADIAAIRRRGGDVIPSFGGYSADHSGRDIADSCPSAAGIAAAYEKVVTTYGVTRLDLDVEDRSLDHPAAIERRNAAIRLVQDWAARQGRTVEFAYTLPSSMSGLDPEGVAILQDARRQGAQIRVVNAMTFDFYDDVPHEMGRDSIVAARAVHRQMRQVYPEQSEARLWSRLGVTEMVGIDDFGPAETLTLADAGRVTRWAKAHHIAFLSFWALQRDNGGCPGDAGGDSCSGVAQQDWQFSQIFEQFSRR
jgi:chitinase